MNYGIGKFQVKSICLCGGCFSTQIAKKDDLKMRNVITNIHDLVCHLCFKEEKDITHFFIMKFDVFFYSWLRCDDTNGILIR